MEQQTITINVPDGKIAKFNADNNTIEFVDKDPVRSKSWEEFCENNPFLRGVKEYFLNYRHIESTSGVPCGRLSSDKNLLATKEDAEGIRALIQLTRLHDEWVGDWKPGNDLKFTIFVSDINLIGVSSFYRRSLLQFPTGEMANEFMSCFKPLLEKAKKFI